MQVAVWSQATADVLWKGHETSNDKNIFELGAQE